MNPVEWLWLHPREHYGSNRVYPDLDDLERATVAGWRAVGLHPDRVRTVCRCEYFHGGR